MDAHQNAMWLLKKNHHKYCPRCASRLHPPSLCFSFQPGRNQSFSCLISSFSCWTRLQHDHLQFLYSCILDFLLFNASWCKPSRHTGKWDYRDPYSHRRRYIMHAEGKTGCASMCVRSMSMYVFVCGCWIKVITALSFHSRSKCWRDSQVVSLNKVLLCEKPLR